MAEQQSGLRFDIYERVHLSEGVAGIKEMEDVELVPHIQVIPQDDQALLRGNLLLTGTYVDEQGAVNRTLEHLIPVEITLPMNRVQRVEDIAVEIENFDVDLLSTRSLNITGVLSLNGLEVVSSPAGEAWSESEEEVVFIHEAQDPRLQDPRYAEPNPQSWQSPGYAEPNPQSWQSPGYAEPNPQSWQSPGYAEPNPQSWQSPGYAEPNLQSWQSPGHPQPNPQSWQDPRYTEQNPQNWSGQPYPEPNPQIWPGQPYADPNPQNGQDPRYAEPQQQSWPNSPQPGSESPSYSPQSVNPLQTNNQPEEWSNPGLAYAAANPIQQEPESRFDDERQSLTLESGVLPPQEAEELSSEAGNQESLKPTAEGEQQEANPPEEKKELKIAFSGKKTQEEPSQEKPIGFTSLLQNAVASKNEMRTNQEKASEAVAQAPGPGNANAKLEWKKLLLSSMNEQNEFRRVRLCIVQKEETLESIAKRYDLNPREIALFNRLGDTDLAEGQVVYIPKA